MAKKKIIFQGEPGANSDLACREAYPDYEPVPCPTFEDCFTALTHRRCRSRHDPDRELGRRPRRRHPSSDADRAAAHHRRMVPADPQSVDGAEGRHACRPSRRCRATCMALGQCRNVIRELKLKPVVAADTAGSAREVAEANDIDPRGHRLAAGRRDLRPRHPEGERRGRSQFDHALRRAVAREEMGRARQRQGHHHLRVPGAQPAGRALQGDGRLRHQRRQHDQARKLHGRRQFLRHAVLCRRRGPPRRHARWCSRSKSSPSSPRN